MKWRLEQQLLLRGSCDFDEPAEYGELLAEVFRALNAPRQQCYEQKLEHLGALSAFRLADGELLTVRGRSTSTIEVRQVTVWLHHERLIVYLGIDWVCQLPRGYRSSSHGPRAWCIDLEHLIDGLHAKPRALLHCRYQPTSSLISTGGTSGSSSWPMVIVTPLHGSWLRPSMSRCGWPH